MTLSAARQDPPCPGINLPTRLGAGTAVLGHLAALLRSRPSSTPASSPVTCGKGPALTPVLQGLVPDQLQSHRPTDPGARKED